jgi:hypothetical protein
MTSLRIDFICGSPYGLPSPLRHSKRAPWPKSDNKCLNCAWLVPDFGPAAIFLCRRISRILNGGGRSFFVRRLATAPTLSLS